MDSEQYILDLARINLELDDEELTTKNLTACLFALCVKGGVSPGQFLPEFMENMPGYDDWFEDYLPEIMDYSGNTEGEDE